MHQGSDSNFVPRAPRFRVADASEAVVTITRTEESNHQPLLAELVDVSQHGAKLRVPVNLRFEESLQLKIEVLDAELSYLGVASVRHIRAVDDEYWLVGCAIAPPLSEKAFSYLAITAGKERRRFRRLAIAAEATVRRQAQAEGTLATLHNLSSGGFCFSSVGHYNVGEKIQLTVEGTDGLPRVIDASICWQVEGSEGSIAGCQFASQDSYAKLSDCVTELPDSTPASPSDAEPTSKLVLTAAVLAMFVPPVMTLLLQANKVSAEGSGSPPAVERPVAVESKLASELPKPRHQTSEPVMSPEEQTTMPTAVESPLREWIDSTGKHHTQATLVEVTAAFIVLKKSNGRQSIVPLSRLSKADREFAAEWQSRAE